MLLRFCRVLFAPYALLLLLLLLCFACNPHRTIEAHAQSINISQLPTCPFSRWQGEPRYCYECRWCPFRAQTCCEIEDEYDVLKSINVSGTDSWDCFITIAHFQQCGRCSPSAKSYLMQGDLDTLNLNYVWEWRNLSIRPCKQACEYIYKQCNGAKMLNGKPVIPDGLDVGRFCAPFPQVSTPETPCFNAAVKDTACSLGVALTLLLVSWWAAL